ncbi:MAG TPA: zinc-dependent metalloprotease [Planctomycetota bacterium]|nr:zinc-dependent metalloprotease [Planctomycetota bacterium]
MRLIVITLAACIIASSTARAGGPLLIGKDGVPRRWRSTSPVVLNLDPGSLGSIQNSTAIIEHAVREWTSIETSSLRVVIGAPLSSDIEGLTEKEFNNFVGKNDGTNPLIFDSTGEMFDVIYGPKSGVIGVAGPSLILTADGTIIKGFAMFNGEKASPQNAEIFKAAVTHELGHMLNLDHAQINGIRIGVPLPGFEGTASGEDVATMFPVLIQTTSSQHPMATLHRDDRAALSALYPAASFAAGTASIFGHVLDVDGATPLSGINVIARNVSDPFRDCISYVSGHLAAGQDDPEPTALAAFELKGLTPNAPYKVYIEEVAIFFTGGARVGPLDPPLNVDTTQTAAFLEFWNGVNESAENPPDDPTDANELRIAAGAAAVRIDFIFNGVKPRVRSIEPAAGSYFKPHVVTLWGANFARVSTVLLVGAEAVYLSQVRVEERGKLLATVPAGVVPGVYDIVVTTTHGSSNLGSAFYTVTEPPPLLVGARPDLVENHRALQVTLEGTNLLGTETVRLERPGFPAQDLSIIDILSAERVLVEVPSGLLPGTYAVVLFNTEGASASHPEILVVELEPLLSGETSPSSAGNRTSKNVRILGENLVGTKSVELLTAAGSISVKIVSTSLNDVVVIVPRGIEPGIYTVRVTNSEGTTTGPSTFQVKASRGDGGGCAAMNAGDARPESLLTIAILLAAGILAGRRGARPEGAGLTRSLSKWDPPI